MTKENKSLSEKRQEEFTYDNSKMYVYPEKDVKEKIQNAQRRLKEELKKRIDNNTNCRDIDEGTLFDWEVDEITDKIFLEEFGGKLI